MQFNVSIYNYTTRRKINAIDIVNIDDIEIDYNANIYASSAKIGYMTDQTEKESKNYINDEFEQEVLEIHRKPSEYDVDSLLPTLDGAMKKASVIMDDQKAVRPVFRGVKVAGLEWINRHRIFDIIYADISIPGITVPANIPFDVFNIYLSAEESILISVNADSYKEIEHSETYELLEFSGGQEQQTGDYKYIVFLNRTLSGKHHH